ncbi:NAD(P)-dependent oxidoreductase [Micromonospora sp. NPDC023966]|uniref:NAD(P)-dependent oxidoreductase n=1 Tax=Micromonospora sp. NPDC023966 TaxID=3154699 RepID=UPI0033D57AFC
MEVAIIGLGRMGLSLARALVGAGVSVSGCDVSLAARERAAGDGVRVADDLAGVASRSDVVITSLPTVAAVRGVVFELGTLMRPGTLVVETSTCAPAFGREAVERLAARGVRFVDCPVSGKPPVMTMLIGGAPGVLGGAEQVLAAAVRTMVHLGKPGAGYGVKLLQQYIKYARFLVAAEALTFAESEGLDVPETVRALSAGTGALPGLATAEEHFLGDAAAVASHAPVTTIVKDLELARAMFHDAGFESPSFFALSEFFLAAGAVGLEERPYPEVIDLLSDFRFAKGEPC